MVPAGEGSPCELSSVLLSCLLIADIFVESLALPAECSVSGTARVLEQWWLRRGDQQKQEVSSSGPMKLCGRGAMLRSWWCKASGAIILSD